MKMPDEVGGEQILRNITSIKYKKLCFCYPGKINDFEVTNLEFEIRKNDIIGIIGHNGSGKNYAAQITCRIV